MKNFTSFCNEAEFAFRSFIMIMVATMMLGIVMNFDVVWNLRGSLLGQVMFATIGFSGILYFALSSKRWSWNSMMILGVSLASAIVFMDYELPISSPGIYPISISMGVGGVIFGLLVVASLLDKYTPGRGRVIEYLVYFIITQVMGWLFVSRLWSELSYSQICYFPILIGVIIYEIRFIIISMTKMPINSLEEKVMSWIGLILSFGMFFLAMCVWALPFTSLLCRIFGMDPGVDPTIPMHNVWENIIVFIVMSGVVYGLIYLMCWFVEKTKPAKHSCNDEECTDLCSLQ